MARNDREKWIFDNFKKLLLDFPNGEIDYDSEAPDFIIKSDCTNIGVEVTELFRENSRDSINILQESESVKRQISERLTKRLEKSSLKPLFVSISYNDKIKLTKNIVDTELDKLFKFIKSNEPDINSEIVYDDFNNPECLSDGLNYIKIRHINDLPFFEVTIPLTTWLPKLNKSHLESRIIQKELKLNNYFKKAEEVWLLIAIDTSSLATFYRLPKPDLSLEFNTNFDRIFVLSVNRGELIELDVKK